MAYINLLLILQRLLIANILLSKQDFVFETKTE